MEVHLHAFAAYPRAVAGTFQWLNPLFNEQPGCAMAACGFPIVMVWVSRSVNKRRWTQLTCEFWQTPANPTGGNPSRLSYLTGCRARLSEE